MLKLSEFAEPFRPCIALIALSEQQTLIQIHGASNRRQLTQLLSLL